MAKKKTRAEKVIPQNISDPGDIQESLALKKLIDRSKKSLKEGKSTPLKDVMNDIRAKAKRLKSMSGKTGKTAKTLKDLKGIIKKLPKLRRDREKFKEDAMAARTIVKKFDNGEDISEHLDVSKASRPNKSPSKDLKDIGNVKKLAGKYKGPKDLSGKHDDYLTEDSRRAAYHDLDHLAGTWSEKDAAEFQKNIEDLESFDPRQNRASKTSVQIGELSMKTQIPNPEGILTALELLDLSLLLKKAIKKCLPSRTSVEIPDAEVIESGGDIIIIPASNRPRAYKKLLAVATKVMGDKELATLWLYEKQFGLDDIRPVDHMRTAKGAEEVEDLLLRLAYGDCL